MDARRRNFIRNHCTVKRNIGELTIYEINTKVVYRDKDNKIQVVSIGPANEVPIKAVLLLGETGAGKTHAINTMINYLLHVRFEDDFRFQLKDYVSSDNLRQIDSQTEYITAYIISRHLGVPFDCNYALIDSPGFGDTRENHERATIERLTHFLTTDYGIDYLDCVGLVAKSNQNRISNHQLQMLKEFTSVLGSDIGVITQLLATHASDGLPLVLDVVKNAKVQFQNWYAFDNWPLYISKDDNVHQEGYLEYRWRKMQEEQGRFFKDLQNVHQISLKRTRELLQEKQSFEKTKSTLMNNIKMSVVLKNKIVYLNKNLKKSTELVNNLEEVSWVKCTIPRGYHVHNCDICQKTCREMCENPKNIAAAFAGTGAGVGTATVAGLASAGIAGGVGGAEVGALGGPVGAIIGLSIGAGIGLISGLSTGLAIRKATKNCLAHSREVCHKNGCRHELKDHVVDTEYVWRIKIDPSKIDTYFLVLEESSQLKKQITDNEKTLKDLQEKRNILAEDFMKHIEKINELGTEQTNPDLIISEIILGERENFQHVELLKEFNKKLSDDYTAGKRE
ncbi:hypothetical protein OTU49_012550 [Cherax quadricarinatus]|uniref:G domain-containing protein n=1 Tax=Cherax quadricarinatus TaxID=27406 RepID=A0AAW0VWN4_CHEQU